MNDDQRYYAGLAAAFVRGTLGEQVPGNASDDEVIALGQSTCLRLHHFKRSAVLPRVQRVIGILRGLAPESLLDVGSGRGAFLWPLLEAFPALPVLAIDQDARHIVDIQAVSQGGISTLAAAQMDVTLLNLPDASVDGVAILEVLEHLARPADAVREVMRVARRFVIASVPSRPDHNPEHIHLFTRDSLSALFTEAGATRVNVEYVLNHMILVARSA